MFLSILIPKPNIGVDDSISRFPVEILTEIFCHTLLPLREAPHSRNPPLRLWRNLTLFLPRARLSPLAERNVHYLIRLWRFALRSPTLAIHVELPGDKRSDSITVPNAGSGLQLFRIVRCFSYYIRELSFPAGYYLDFAQIAKDLPSALDTLSLYSKVDLQQRRPTDCSIFDSCRSLRKLKLWLERGSFDAPTLFHFPWEHLTHLIIASPVNATNWRKIMARCKSAQLCSFNVDWSEEPRGLDRYMESNPPIVLPHLHTFSISFGCTAATPGTNWFAKLKLPALVKFSFHGIASHFPAASDLSMEYLASLRHIPNTKSISSLSLVHIRIPITHVLDALRSMPRLRELHLCCNRMDYNPFFLALAVPPHKHDEPARVPLIPELETLLILFPHSATERRWCNFTGSLKVMVSCVRNRPLYPLCEIMLKFESTCGHNILAAEEIREMLELYGYDVGRTIFTKNSLDPPIPRVDMYYWDW
ncbi:hypothetical protein BD779DRAFT_1729880 [Infundibulicybe gibba]|nr:hypothetical protein BD779DRAFT_1729880 [Infundibulicybe gibba]